MPLYPLTGEHYGFADTLQRIFIIEDLMGRNMPITKATFYRPRLAISKSLISLIMNYEDKTHIKQTIKRWNMKDIVRKKLFAALTREGPINLFSKTQTCL